MPRTLRSRVFLIITRMAAPPGGSVARRELLVLSHADPRHYAGVQTPGGTIEAAEDVLRAALREAAEETGLTEFGNVALVAEDVGQMGEETVRRYFVHLPVAGATRDEWKHRVTGDGVDLGIEFVLRWIPLEQAAATLHPYFRDHLDRIPNGRKS